MICKKRIVETFDKRQEKRAVILPTDESHYYVEKVNFGYCIEQRMTSRVQEAKVEKSKIKKKQKLL